MSGAEASRNTVSSLWRQTAELGYMRQNGRAEHTSHAAFTEWLEARFGGERFSLLDAGVMSGVTYERLQQAGLSVDYRGIDISAAMLEDCSERFPAAEWSQMSVMDLSYRRDSFEVVYCRHLLECLPYYETAVREMFRVSRRFVVLCFFQPPAAPERIHRQETEGGYLWLNRYAPEPLEALLRSLSKNVESVDIEYQFNANRLYFCEL